MDWWGSEQTVNAEVRLGDTLALTCCGLLFLPITQGNSRASEVRMSDAQLPVPRISHYYTDSGSG